jgi:hypothetical protein
LYIWFKSDGKFILQNANRNLALTITISGIWKEYKKNSFIVNCPVLDSITRIEYRKSNQNAGSPGSIINWGIARTDFSKIIPYPIEDTICFSKKYKTFIIRGFQFKIQK